MFKRLANAMHTMTRFEAWGPICCAHIKSDLPFATNGWCRLKTPTFRDSQSLWWWSVYWRWPHGRSLHIILETGQILKNYKFQPKKFSSLNEVINFIRQSVFLDKYQHSSTCAMCSTFPFLCAIWLFGYSNFLNVIMSSDELLNFFY